jgi:hypothetical protein
MMSCTNANVPTLRASKAYGIRLGTNRLSDRMLKDD